MFLIRNGSTKQQPASMADRARGLATQAVPQARRAGTAAASSVKQGVTSARGWAAPRLDGAAEVMTGSVAPKVSSALHSTAKRVSPEPAGRTGWRRVLDWRVLLGAGAVLAAAGAAAALTMRRHYEQATLIAKDDTEPEVTVTATEEMAGSRARLPAGRPPVRRPASVFMP